MFNGTFLCFNSNVSFLPPSVALTVLRLRDRRFIHKRTWHVDLDTQICKHFKGQCWFLWRSVWQLAWRGSEEQLSWEKRNSTDEGMSESKMESQERQKWEMHSSSSKPHLFQQRKHHTDWIIKHTFSYKIFFQRQHLGSLCENLCYLWTLYFSTSHSCPAVLSGKSAQEVPHHSCLHIDVQKLLSDPVFSTRWCCRYKMTIHLWRRDLIEGLNHLD